MNFLIKYSSFVIDFAMFILGIAMFFAKYTKGALPPSYMLGVLVVIASVVMFIVDYRILKNTK